MKIPKRRLWLLWLAAGLAGFASAATSYHFHEPTPRPPAVVSEPDPLKTSGVVKGESAAELPAASVTLSGAWARTRWVSCSESARVGLCISVYGRSSGGETCKRCGKAFSRNMESREALSLRAGDRQFFDGCFWCLTDYFDAATAAGVSTATAGLK